jgi:circadian clock protein KaiB
MSEMSDGHSIAFALPDGEKVVLRLYVAGSAPRSSLAIRTIKWLCEKHLAGRYDLKVIDIYQQPWLAREAQLVAAPTLVREHPLPARRFVGSMSSVDRLFAGLGALGPLPGGAAPS